MQRKFVYQLGITVVVLVVVSVSVLSLRIIAQARQDSRVPIQGQTAPLISRAQLLGAANAQQSLNLSIGLQPRNQQELEGLLRDMYDPHSSMYHRFLTPQEFAGEFGPTPDQQQQVANYLRGQGFDVTSISPNGLLIDANATVVQAESTFQVAINNYQLGTHTFYANASAPTVPASLSSLIASIGGLDDSVQYHPLYQRMKKHMQNHGLALATPGGFGPKDLSGAYNATPLQNAGILGDNQPVALFELDGYHPSDVTHYFQNYGLATPKRGFCGGSSGRG